MTDTLEDLKRILQNHEVRLKILEGTYKQNTGNTTTKKKQNNNHSGLAGGIRLLIDEGFLNEPKFLNEIFIELKRQGYHYSVKSISKALLVDFMKKWKLITRLQENKNWKYAVKK